MDLKIETIPESDLKGGVKPGQALDFGKEFTDRMFQMRYVKGAGWQDAVIKKYENFSLSPATMSLHYGQLIFEGLKFVQGFRDTIQQLHLVRVIDVAGIVNQRIVTI